LQLLAEQPVWNRKGKKSCASGPIFISIKKTFVSAFILSSIQGERLSALRGLMSYTFEYRYGLRGSLMNMVLVESRCHPNWKKIWPK